MFYAKVNNGQVEAYPLTLTDIRLQMPNVSLSINVTKEELEQFGYVQVVPATEPAFDYTKNLTRTAVASGDEFIEVWQQTEASQDEIAQRIANKADEIRSKRDLLLSQSDWTQLADVSENKEAWSVYRQSLRDIPLQQGFPYNVIWPITP